MPKWAARRWWRDEAGSTAVPVAIVLMLLLACGAFALDYTRASGAREALQEALDAATLKAAKGIDDTKVQNDGVQYLTANIEGQQALTKVSSTFTVSQTAVIGKATAEVEPFFLGVPMKGPYKVSAQTEVKRAINSSLEVALVLDTTGSMAGTKIATLKMAAANLVNKITSQPKADVKIAVMPFAQYVNIGVSRRNESWANVPADWSKQVPASCKTITSKTTCDTQTYSCTKYNDGVPYQATCSKSVNCKTTPVDPPQTTCKAAYTETHKFSGCIGSPPYPKNVTDTDPYRLYPGYLDTTCGSEITPLTANEATVNTAITALKATGETYVPAGLAWGFNALSSPKPLIEAKAYDLKGPNVQPRKVLVLMTDGENTLVMRASDGRHVAPSSTAKLADDYTAELCTNIKAQNIEVFAVAFAVGNGKAKKLIEDCATDKDHYFDAADSSALLEAFDRIAQALQSLYIAR